MNDLKVTSVSDRELLHMLGDLGDNEGWVSTDTLAQNVALAKGNRTDEEQQKFARHCISTRLSWIRRLSMTVEKSESSGADGSKWRLTVAGREVVKAKLNADLSDKLGRIGEFATLGALDVISRRYARADVPTANLMRREWVTGTSRRTR